MAKLPLTKRQHDVLNFLRSYSQKNGFPPTMQEICNEFKVSSTNGVSQMLDALEKKGYIRRQAKGISRGLVILDEDTKVQEQKLKSEGIVPITIIGDGTAANPFSPFMSPRGTVRIDTTYFGAEGTLFASIVEDDGMSGEGILRGDTVIVRQEQEIRDGDLVLALYNDVKLLRRYILQGGLVLLTPAAKGFPKIKTERRSTDTVILGVAVGILRKLRRE